MLGNDRSLAGAGERKFELKLGGSQQTKSSFTNFCPKNAPQQLVPGQDLLKSIRSQSTLFSSKMVLRPLIFAANNRPREHGILKKNLFGCLPEQPQSPSICGMTWLNHSWTDNMSIRPVLYTSGPLPTRATSAPTSRTKKLRGSLAGIPTKPFDPIPRPLCPD